MAWTMFRGGMTQQDGKPGCFAGVGIGSGRKQGPRHVDLQLLMRVHERREECGVPSLAESLFFHQLNSTPPRRRQHHDHHPLVSSTTINNITTSRVNSPTCLRPVWITWRLDRILQNKAETDIIARSAADCVTTTLLRLPQYLAVQPLRPAIPPHLHCPPHTVHNTLFHYGLHAASLDLATGLSPAHR